MPHLDLRTNIRVHEKEELMRRLSGAVCETLGKIETYMIVEFKEETPLLVSDSTDPAATMVVRATGLEPNAAKLLAEKLTTLVQKKLRLERQRISIVFKDTGTKSWTWGGQGFA